MYVLTNLGRLHCTHQGIIDEKWECQWRHECELVFERARVRMDGAQSDSSHIVQGEKTERVEGGSEEERCSPTSSQVNIDTALEDTAPAALITHFQ